GGIQMKMNSNLLKCERGTGAVISTVMFLIISILFIGGTFVWQVKGQYQVDVLDNSRIQERYLVEPTFSYNQENEAYSAIINVQNIGPIEIKLVQAWIIDEANNDHKHIDISYTLGVDESTYISEIDTLIQSLTHPFNLYESTYYIKIVSERGNIASSRLTYGAEMNIDSDWPIIIDRETSWVRKVGSKGHIKLDVFNRLDEAVTISLIVATKLDQGAEQSEILYVDWTLQPGKVNVGTFFGDNGQVYQKGETIFIELASSEGIVISSTYFICI
ncbi:hypothetical protein KAI60_05280, partial [Candidatus Bathyarchaeota archaeon]|nr:hypothetical protein [Candidatus Bathyarchaeota archaeon]